jgi:hypothetical protein
MSNWYRKITLIKEAKKSADEVYYIVLAEVYTKIAPIKRIQERFEFDNNSAKNMNLTYIDTELIKKIQTMPDLEVAKTGLEVDLNKESQLIIV